MEIWNIKIISIILQHKTQVSSRTSNSNFWQIKLVSLCKLSTQDTFWSCTPNYWYIKCSCSTLLYLKKEINKKLCFLVTRDFIQMINCTKERNQVQTLYFIRYHLLKETGMDRNSHKPKKMLTLTILYLFYTLTTSILSS